jgi:hypothetical protein
MTLRRIAMNRNPGRSLIARRHPVWSHPAEQFVLSYLRAFNDLSKPRSRVNTICSSDLAGMKWVVQTLNFSALAD